MELYRSPYEAYPFLSEEGEDLRCDFELLTDRMASETGLLRAQVADEALGEELLWVCQLVYHLNPTLRTFLSVTEGETERLHRAAERLRRLCAGRCELFVLPQGCQAACTAHLLRVDAKMLVRLIYRHCRQGHDVPPALLDAANLLSGYFFYLALYLNALAGVEETPFVSRNYGRGDGRP